MEKTTLRMAVRRTANPSQVSWEVEAHGVHGTLQLHAYVGASAGVCHLVEPGYAAANGGIALIAPNAAVHFWAFLSDAGPGNVDTRVSVDGNLQVGQTVAEVENHAPAHC